MTPARFQHIGDQQAAPSLRRHHARQRAKRNRAQVRAIRAMRRTAGTAALMARLAREERNPYGEEES